MPPPPLPVTTLGYAPPPAGRVDLRKVALHQRNIIYALLGYFGAALLSGLLAGISDEMSLAAGAVTGLVALAAIVTAAVFVFILAIDVYDVGIGVLFGLLTLIPCLGVIFLLIVNGRATSVLRQYGIRVGFMGARLADLPAPGQVYIR